MTKKSAAIVNRRALLWVLLLFLALIPASLQLHAQGGGQTRGRVKAKGQDQVEIRLRETRVGFGYGIVEGQDALAKVKFCIKLRSLDVRTEAECYSLMLPGFQRWLLEKGDNPDNGRPAALPSACQTIGFWDDPFLLQPGDMAIYQCPANSVPRSVPAIQETLAACVIFFNCPEPEPRRGSAEANAEWYVRVGRERGLRDLDGALDDFTKAIELKPEYAEAYYFRGLAKQAKGDVDGAVADFAKAIELKPDYPDARAHLQSIRPQDKD